MYVSLVSIAYFFLSSLLCCQLLLHNIVSYFSVQLKHPLHTMSIVQKYINLCFCSYYSSRQSIEEKCFLRLLILLSNYSHCSMIKTNLSLCLCHQSLSCWCLKWLLPMKASKTVINSNFLYF